MTTPRRSDERKNEDMRQIKHSYDALARVDGSARFSFGDITALASLSGPIEVRLAAELPSKAAFEVLTRPLSNVPATESKSLATIVRSSLEPSLILTKNPRTLVQLVVQSLSPSQPNIWNTTLAAAMINASTLAFLNAGSIPMKGVVAAVAIGRNREGYLIADPSDEELDTSQGRGCFAFMFSDDVGSKDGHSDCLWASWKSTTGGYDEKEVFVAEELAKEKAEVVYKLMRTSVSKKFWMDIGTKEEDGQSEESGDEKMDI